ncbi:hypothetical protein H2200_006811 [Cladophialophora chaetospira]|uniref:Uncharacterized protein n=1 Tax=Cladophialophora chaetospira TaxID=386627 RepID=A0AA38X921_9EURO|nr:hypothetical protein H2200_006811 [Cladophialophora chaetospira]
MVTPTAIRMMQATRAGMFRAAQRAPAQAKSGPLVYRENRVPYYQRLFQNHDGKRQWRKTNRSPYLLYPYYTILLGSFTFSVVGMVRLLFGHKSIW